MFSEGIPLGIDFTVVFVGQSVAVATESTATVSRSERLSYRGNSFEPHLEETRLANSPMLPRSIEQTASFRLERLLVFVKT